MVLRTNNAGGRQAGQSSGELRIGGADWIRIFFSGVARQTYSAPSQEIDTRKLCKKLRDSVLLEMDTLRKINHPNIVRLHDIVTHPHRIFLVLEYCSGGDLAAYIQRYGRLSVAEARYFMIQLAAGLKVFREKNLIHRDLKPQNLLLSINDRNVVLKIADFGYARSIKRQGLAETLCGSPLYMAPEVMQYKKYNAKADLWSVGAILFQLVTGNPPFFGNSQMELLRNIMRSKDLHFPHDIVGDLHPDCIDLCKKLLRRNPFERLSFEEFFNHRFMQVETVIRPIGHHEDNSIGSPDNSVVETAEASHDSHCLTCNKKSPASKEEASNNLDSGCSYISMPEGSFVSALGSTFEDVQPANGSFVSALESTFEDVQPANGSFVGVLESTFEDVQPTSKTRLVNSFECIEQEEVSPYGLHHSENVASSPKESDKSRSSVPLETCEAWVSSRDVFDKPSDHAPTRLDSLLRYAHVISEVVKEKLNVGQQLEALEIQLVCLAIWKQALFICHNWSVKLTDDLAVQGVDMHKEEEFQSAASYCSEVEQEFVSAVENAEELLSHLGPLDNNAEMPNAMEIVFETALALGRKGAVNELLEIVDDAAAFYSKSITLMSFILVEASSLELIPPFFLTIFDRRRLHRYIDRLSRHKQSIEQRSVLLRMKASKVSNKP